MATTALGSAGSGGAPRATELVAREVRFDRIPRSAWDRLLARTAVPTPFSRWNLHRAWWDAYGSTAHEQYLVCVPPSAASGEQAGAGTFPEAAIRGIVPLMHRHEVEADDSATATALRRRFRLAGTRVPATAKAVFFGASYHADYATILCDPADLPATARATVSALAESPSPASSGRDWDVVDLRRLRDDDPARGALEEAFRACAPALGWDVLAEQEDVCPVVEFAARDWDSYLASLPKAGRHEIRRKWRRLEKAGDVSFALAEPTPETVERFIALHQERWGADGLFPETKGGDRSRRFLHRLAELEFSDPAGGQLQFGRLDASGRTIFASAGFDDGRTTYFYNMGIDPTTRELSPGVNGTAAYLRDRLAAGRERFDFLRGDEPYKYEWGAHDHPIYRILVTRLTAPR